MKKKWKEQYSLGKASLDNQEYKKSLHYFIEILKDGGSFADVHNYLGIIYHELGSYNDAINSFEEALEINPKYLEVLLNLAVTYIDIGEYRKAMALYSRAKMECQAEPSPPLDPFVRGKLANMHAELGTTYQNLGLLNEAVKEFNTALKLRPDLVDIRVLLGNAYRDMGDFPKAIEELLEAKSIKVDYPSAGINLGITYYSMGKTDKAIKEWDTVLECNPGEKKAEMYLRLVESQR